MNLVDKHFIAYVEENNQKNRENVVHSLEHEYSEPAGWDKAKIGDISSTALKDGLVLYIKDLRGGTIWDASQTYNKSDEQLLSPLEETMKSRYTWWNGKIIESSTPIHHGNIEVGTVIIKYYEPFYFTGHDLDFINMFYETLSIVMLVSIIFAILIGLLISRQISIPIRNAIELTKDISNGNLKRRLDIKSDTLEIKELSGAVNQLAERLEEMEMIRKRIVSDVSHELRTPLTAIQSNMEALIDGIWEPSQERLSNIYKEILRINRLVGDLSKIAKYENKGENLNKTIFNLGEIINRIVTDFELEIHKKNLLVHVKNGVNNIYADEDKISQIIVNVLSNSIKYTSNNEKVNIETFKSNSDVVIKIKDSGIGIPKQDLPYIFERFYRVDKSRNRSTGGSGVGLTIAKAIVEAHNGKIDVISEPGTGTEFIITLPQK